MIEKFVKKIKSLYTNSDSAKMLKPNQTVHVKMDISPTTFTTRIQDIDDKNIYISGISEQEMNNQVLLPDQKMMLYLFSDQYVYQVKSTFKKKIEQPVYMWALAKEGAMKKFSDRRGAYRMDNVVDMNFSISSDLIRQQKHALTKNVSIGGLAVVSRANLSIGRFIDLTLEHIGDKPVVGEIVWKYRHPDQEQWHYGVKFVKISEAQQDILAKHINDKIRALKWAGLD